MKSHFQILLLILFSWLIISCATSDKDFNPAELNEDEFDQVIQVVKIDKTPGEESKEKISQPTSQAPKQTGHSQKGKEKPKAKPVEKEKPKTNVKVEPKTKVEPEKKQAELPQAKPQKSVTQKGPRQPPLEDSEGFTGRRPNVEPYQVGEEIVLGISYFAVEAGKFTMKVMPMVEVNGRKSYHFRYLIKSSPLFSLFYKVDDVAETFVDYENLIPYSYEIHVDETKQKRETRTYFDHDKKKGYMWDRKKLPGKELEKRKKEWDILPFSQNVFSAAYYLRNFTLKVGKELKVRVGHEGKNIEMTAKVIRRETIFTDVGKFDCFVVAPKFDIDGKFKPTGENYLWLTADDRKYIVRLESKIKIGTIVGEVQKIKR